jgi:CheY-like chemotaxis protein
MNAHFLISTCRPDLILMDIQMPGLVGLDLTRQVKADQSMRHVVVVAFTAFAMKGDGRVRRLHRQTVRCRVVCTDGAVARACPRR